MGDKNFLDRSSPLEVYWFPWMRKWGKLYKTYQIFPSGSPLVNFIFEVCLDRSIKETISSQMHSVSRYKGTSFKLEWTCSIAFILSGRLTSTPKQKSFLPSAVSWTHFWEMSTAWQTCNLYTTAHTVCRHFIFYDFPVKRLACYYMICKLNIYVCNLFTLMKINCKQKYFTLKMNLVTKYGR